MVLSLSILYNLSWGRFFIFSFFTIFRGFLFGGNYSGYLFTLISLLFVLGLILYLRVYNLSVLLVQLSLYAAFFVVGYRYNVVDIKEPESTYREVRKILDNKIGNSSKPIPNLSTGKDIRYITFSTNGVLFGCGGNQSDNKPDRNIFSFDPYNPGVIHAQYAVEVKYLYIDEKFGAVYALDFRRYRLSKMDIKDLRIIQEEDGVGLSPQLISDAESEYLYVIYDQPLIVEKRRKDNLQVEARLDVLKSGICPFGSIGISISNGIGDSILASYINCRYNIIEIDRSNMYPLRLLPAEYSIPWYITTSKKRNSLYIAYPEKDFISELDLKNLTIKRRIPAGYGIRFILETTDGKYLFAADYFKGIIYMIDLNSGEVVRSYEFGRKTYAIAEHPTTKNIFVGGPNGIWEIVLNDR